MSIFSLLPFDVIFHTLNHHCSWVDIIAFQRTCKRAHSIKINPDAYIQRALLYMFTAWGAGTHTAVANVESIFSFMDIGWVLTGSFLSDVLRLRSPRERTIDMWRNITGSVTFRGKYTMDSLRPSVWTLTVEYPELIRGPRRPTEILAGDMFKRKNTGGCGMAADRTTSSSKRHSTSCSVPIDVDVLLCLTGIRFSHVDPDSTQTSVNVWGEGSRLIIRDVVAFGEKECDTEPSVFLTAAGPHGTGLRVLDISGILDVISRVSM